MSIFFYLITMVLIGFLLSNYKVYFNENFKFENISNYYLIFLFIFNNS